MSGLFYPDAATEATLEERYGGGKIPFTATVTSSGNTTLITPSTGNRIKVYWVSALTDPDQSTAPLIIFKFGSTELYRVFAVSHWEIFTGAVDEPLVCNLSEASSVAVTVHYAEV